jgi:CBS domain-containing protein
MVISRASTRTRAEAIKINHRRFGDHENETLRTPVRIERTRHHCHDRACARMANPPSRGIYPDLHPCGYVPDLHTCRVRGGAMYDRIEHVLERKGPKVETVAADATVCEAVAVMNDCKIGSVLVGDCRAPVGIFTERDVLVRVVAAGRDPRTTLVRDVMTTEVITISTDATVEDAMRVITEKRCRHLPVCDDSRAICGLISAGDLASWLVRAQRQTIDDLNDYIRAS